MVECAAPRDAPPQPSQPSSPLLVDRYFFWSNKLEVFRIHEIREFPPHRHSLSGVRADPGGQAGAGGERVIPGGAPSPSARMRRFSKRSGSGGAPAGGRGAAAGVCPSLSPKRACRAAGVCPGDAAPGDSGCAAGSAAPTVRGADVHSDGGSVAAPPPHRPASQPPNRNIMLALRARETAAGGPGGQVWTRVAMCAALRSCGDLRSPETWCC